MNTETETKAQTYSLDELCQLADMNLRTVRYYIQQGLVPGPEGKNRGARYFPLHLERLLQIKKWQAAGLSLERIAEIVEQPNAVNIPMKQPQPGSVELWSHLMISEGLQLLIEPGRSGLTSAQIRQLSREILTAYHNLKKAEE
jgi:DNA-binding transcriptional MerR regulator